MKMTLSIWLTSIFLHLGGSPFRKYGCTKIPRGGGGGGRGIMVGPRSIMEKVFTASLLFSLDIKKYQLVTIKFSSNRFRKDAIGHLPAELKKNHTTILESP